MIDRKSGRIHAGRASLLPRPAAPAAIPLMTSAVLALSTLVAAMVISIGLARAQTAGGLIERDTSLVLTLLLVAVVAMGGLSAAAVRFVVRSRRP
jgi:hypothetical protein